jgi:hypothetical protein
VELISLEEKVDHQALTRQIWRDARPFLIKMAWEIFKKSENSVLVLLRASQGPSTKLRSASRERKKFSACKLMMMSLALRLKTKKMILSKNLNSFVLNSSARRSVRQSIAKLLLLNSKHCQKVKRLRTKFCPTVGISRNASNRSKFSLSLVTQPREILTLLRKSLIRRQRKSV